MRKDILLTDELEISDKDYEERLILISKFNILPDEFFAKIRHFQPQIGCLNTCKICSKNSGDLVECWTENRIRNIVAALKYNATSLKRDFPYISWDRVQHRPGVVFPYLDNDIGYYSNLDKFITILYHELGVQTRISTIGFSRYNERLNRMHYNIVSPQKINGLGGVRLSFTPYGKGWDCSEPKLYDRNEYIEDMANFLKIYKCYHDKVGAGYRRMCVEIRYSPLVVNTTVWNINTCGHKVIGTCNYIYISKDIDINMKISEISNPFNNLIELSQEPCFFYEINTIKKIDSSEMLISVANKYIDEGLVDYPECEIYLMNNYEGEYFAINPKLTSEGNYGINIYPRTELRRMSGYTITERFLLNAMFEHKNKKHISSFAKFHDASWEDVENVIQICSINACIYKGENKCEKFEYINNEVIPMIKGYAEALKKAGYIASDFFNPDFTIDTGIICNLGRAIKEFKGISRKKDEPLTPTHERNYGKKNSLMVKEGVAWRLSCGYNNTIVIEKLDLGNTSTNEGQILHQEIVHLNDDDEILHNQELDNNYLIPGQRRK